VNKGEWWFLPCYNFAILVILKKLFSFQAPFTEIIITSQRCWLPELDQLHYFSSITITIAITPSNLSITLQLQLFCANKSNYYYHYFHTCNWLQVEITISFKNMKTIQADMLEWFQKWCQNKLFPSFREQHSLSFSRCIQQFFAYFDTSRIRRIYEAAVSYFLQMLLHNGR